MKEGDLKNVWVAQYYAWSVAQADNRLCFHKSGIILTVLCQCKRLHMLQ